MSSNLETSYSITSVQAMFKTKFGPFMGNSSNFSNVTLSQLAKNSLLNAKEYKFPLRVGHGGNTGSGRLPEATVPLYKDITLTPKKHYARLIVDRLALQGSLTSEDAFASFSKEPLEVTALAFNGMQSRQIFGNDESGSGALGTVLSVSGVGPYDVVMTTATWKEANFEENSLVNFGTSLDNFKINSVTPSTRTINVTRQAAGVTVPTAADIVYNQGSKDAEMVGLGVLTKTSGTVYGATIDRKFSGTFVDLADVESITPDRLNQLALRIEKKCGMAPNIAPFSYEQYEVILNQMEDQKRYQQSQISPVSSLAKGKISFPGIQFLSSGGPINIFPERFVEPAGGYMGHNEKWELYRTPGTGWMTDDNTTFLRVMDEDKYEARYGMYSDLFVNLPFWGKIGRAQFLA